MTPHRRARVTNLLFVVLSLAVLPLAMGAQSTSPKPIALEDYAKFKRITGTSISPDGRWMLYTVTPNEGDATLFVKSLDGDTVHEVVRGTNASFSDDGRWVGAQATPAAGTGPAPARTFELLDLSTGTKTPRTGSRVLRGRAAPGQAGDPALVPRRSASSRFFDHYLKGAPAPLWMTEGVPQLKKGQDPLILASRPEKK